MFDPTAIPTDDIFHPEEIFQLDQPLRMEFPVTGEQHSNMESPPTFADLNGDSRSEDSYWFDWQRAAGGSESSEAPSPELFGNHYQQAEAYCDQQNYVAHTYYTEEAQYFNSDCSRTSPVTESEQLRFYRWNGQDCAQTNIENQTWNNYDCAFACNSEATECRQQFDLPQQQTINAFSALTYN